MRGTVFLCLSGLRKGEEVGAHGDVDAWGQVGVGQWRIGSEGKRCRGDET